MSKSKWWHPVRDSNPQDLESKSSASIQFRQPGIDPIRVFAFAALAIVSLAVWAAVPMVIDYVFH